MENFELYLCTNADGTIICETTKKSMEDNEIIFKVYCYSKIYDVTYLVPSNTMVSSSTYNNTTMHYRSLQNAFRHFIHDKMFSFKKTTCLILDYTHHQNTEHGNLFTKLHKNIEIFKENVRASRFYPIIVSNTYFKYNVKMYPLFAELIARRKKNLTLLYTLDFKTIAIIISFLFGIDSDSEMFKTPNSKFHLHDPDIIYRNSFSWLCDVLLPQHIDWITQQQDPKDGKDGGDTEEAKPHLYDLSLIPRCVKNDMKSRKIMKKVIRSRYH